jgi:hypothetical protein
LRFITDLAPPESPERREQSRAIEGLPIADCRFTIADTENFPFDGNTLLITKD